MNRAGIGLDDNFASGQVNMVEGDRQRGDTVYVHNCCGVDWFSIFTRSQCLICGENSYSFKHATAEQIMRLRQCNGEWFCENSLPVFLSRRLVAAGIID